MERWKPVPGYEGFYEVSDRGDVRSLKRATTSGKVLKLSKTKHGYLKVTLSKNGEHKTAAVHRLVALAFLENPDNKQEVNHKNGIRTDNSLENLEWVTNSENQLHAYRELGKKPTAYWKNRPRKFARRFTPEQVRAIRSDMRSYPEIAAAYHVSKTAIRDIVRRKNYREI